MIVIFVNSHKSKHGIIRDVMNVYKHKYRLQAYLIFAFGDDFSQMNLRNAVISIYPLPCIKD